MALELVTVNGRPLDRTIRCKCRKPATGRVMGDDSGRDFCDDCHPRCFCGEKAAEKWDGRFWCRDDI